MSLDPKKLASEAAALTAAGRLDEAINVHRRLVEATPKSAVAEHNLSSALASAGRWREAQTHVARAFAKGAAAPESWLLKARCAQSLLQLDEAEVSYVEALRRRPLYYDAQRELVQLRWMRTGDTDAAVVDLDAALRAAPSDAELIVIKARLYEHAGQLGRAYALIAASAPTNPNDLAVLTTASQLASELGDCKTSVSFAERAAAIAPNEPVVATTLISACLASGDALRAAALAEQLRRQAPIDQHAIALQATAWRMLGDRRYRALYDYEAFVTATDLDTPTSWSSLDAYITDLAVALKKTHAFATHPLHQSVRHGSQTSDILQRNDDPAIAALPNALNGPIARYIAALTPGTDPLRQRNQGGYAYQGMWSIRMSAGGFHINHVHPQGWLSSACYIEVPAKLHGKEGWLQLGQPGIRTTPALEPEHFIEPAPGKLALFPSYMWHGTLPFTDASARMTVAFDLAPARG